MHIYWRVQQDLSCLGETIQFHDPAFIRSMKKWILKNYSGVTFAESHFHIQKYITGKN